MIPCSTIQPHPTSFVWIPSPRVVLTSNLKFSVLSHLTGAGPAIDGLEESTGDGTDDDASDGVVEEFTEGVELHNEQV